MEIPLSLTLEANGGINSRLVQDCLLEMRYYITWHGMAANLESLFIIMTYVKVQAALNNAPKLVASRLAPRTKKLYNEVAI